MHFIASLWFSSRFALTIVGFFGFINLYALRVDMSVAIVCMTRQEVQSSNITCNAIAVNGSEINSTQDDGVVCPDDEVVYYLHDYHRLKQVKKSCSCFSCVLYQLFTVTTISLYPVAYCRGFCTLYVYRVFINVPQLKTKIQFMYSKNTRIDSIIALTTCKL